MYHKFYRWRVWFQNLQFGWLHFWLAIIVDRYVCNLSVSSLHDHSVCNSRSQQVNMSVFRGIISSKTKYFSRGYYITFVGIALVMSVSSDFFRQYSCDTILWIYLLCIIISSLSINIQHIHRLIKITSCLLVQYHRLRLTALTINPFKSQLSPFTDMKLSTPCK